jgi:hypothetical protein
MDGTFSELCPTVDAWVLPTVLEDHVIPLPQSAMKCILVAVVISLPVDACM